MRASKLESAGLGRGSSWRDWDPGGPALPRNEITANAAATQVAAIQSSRSLQPVQRLRIVGKGEVPHFGRGEVLGQRFPDAGDRAVRHDGQAFDLLVVTADEVHVRGESPEVLPPGKC